MALSLSLAHLLGQGSFLLLGEIYSELSLRELEALLDQGHWVLYGFGRRGLRRVTGGQTLPVPFSGVSGLQSEAQEQSFSRGLVRCRLFPIHVIAFFCFSFRDRVSFV